MLSASCARVLQGKTEDITVISDPIGADVTLSNGMTGITPFTITVPRERDLAFHYSKPGYHSVSVYDDANVEDGYITADWVSILLTGIPVAWLTDVSSGAAHTHTKTTVAARLYRDPTYVARLAPAPTPTPAAAPSPEPGGATP